MSMSLTISQPAKVEFGGRTTHDFSPRISLAKSRVSPQPRIDSPLSSLRVGSSNDSKMTTPHRGLPPPAAMTLPDPGRPPPSIGPHLGAMPDAPPRWQGQEESMRNWLVAKAEEDRRKQEEEKTRQESYRLEQRRIEQSMMREALQAGVPPALVPIIYAGMGGSSTTNFSIEWLQQYASQLQVSQQQQIPQQHSPNELRRETRLIGQASSQYGGPQQQVVPSQPADQSQQPGPLQTTFSAYQPGQSRGPPTSAPRSATHTQLPRLTTNEMYVHQPTQQGPGSAHPLQHSQTLQQDQPASSPSIYFHHWVPPNESKNNQPQTPAGKGEPHSAHPSSHLSEADYRESPRKRKAQGAHERPPPPSAGPQYTSPPFSTTSSTSGRKVGHGRSRSNTESRPESRRDPDPPRSSQPGSGELSDERRRRDSPPSMPQDESTTETEPPRAEHREERPESRDSR